jgi:hypothetical protein
LLHFVDCVLVCLVLGVFTPEPPFEGLQDQDFKDPDLFPRDQQG